MAILSNINGLFAVEDNGAIKFNNLTGTNNQVLIANTNSSPTWVNVDTIIGGPYLPLTGGTLAGAGNLVIGGTLAVNGVTTFNENVLMGNTVTNPASGFTDQTGIGLKYSTTVPEIQVSSDSAAMQLGRTSTGGDGQIMAMRKASVVIHSFATNNVSIGTNATFAGNVIQSGTSPQHQFVTPNNFNFQIAVQENVSNTLEITPSTTAGGTTFSTPAVLVNSSGDVGIGATGLYSTARALNLPGKGISFKNDVNGSNNNWSYIYNTATGSSSNLVFATGQSLTALTLAHSGHATFAGGVTVSGISSTLNTGNSGTFVTNDANNYPRISTASANIQLGLFRTSTGSGGVYIGGFSGGFEVRNGSTLAPIFNVDQSGNVGIGTTSPDDLLTLAASTCSYSTAPVVRFDSTCTDSANIRNWAIGPADSSYGNFHIFKSAARGGDPVNTAGITFTIDYTGNVGIGSTDAIEKLQVVGQLISTGSNSTSATAGAERAIMDLSGFSATDHSARFGHFRGTNSAGAGQLRLYTDSVERVRINAIGNVGIGTTSPTTALSVTDGAAMYANNNYLVQIKRNATNSNDDTSKACILLANNSNAFQIAYGGATDRLRFINGGGTEQMTLLNGGNVGIGTTAPNRKLDINAGSVYPLSIDSTQRYLMEFARSGTSEWWIAVDGGKFILHENGVADQFDMSGGTGTFRGDVVAYGSPSDIRLKENIKPIKNPLGKIKKLKGVTFDWKKSKSILDIKEDYGFIAQDVKKVIPELVRKNENELLSMRHQGIIPILVEAIKELEARVKELENK